jgi:para-nitrobenzyl esterase
MTFRLFQRRINLTHIHWLTSLLLSGLCQSSMAVSTPDRVPLVVDCEATLESSEGPVSGYLEEKYDRQVCAYKGIPFAQPPVGDLRWRAPQDALPREEILQALSYGPDCMQAKGFSDMIIQSGTRKVSEDCLYLNIWRPARPGQYPVMVWIHGGALLIGSGAWPIYQGTSLAALQDVLVVTINYRLGPFGYLSHPDLVDENDGVDGGSAGNYGLMDQQQALKWIQQNIKAFSGDPGNVTIFGESSGGWSVFSLLVSPSSKGLFHKAIAQSGGSETSRESETAFRIGERFAEKLECKDGDIASCLRAVPADRVQSESMTMNLRCMMTTKIRENFCFLPREDGTLLPDRGMELIENGDYMKIPVLAGYNSKDPWFLRSSTIDSLELMSGHKKYLYRFKFKKNAFNFASSGVHGAELPFVFDTLADFRLFYDRISLFNDKQIQRSRELTNNIQAYWTNFARTGDPNGVDLNGEALPLWPEHMNSEHLRLYNIIEARD